MTPRPIVAIILGCLLNVACGDLMSVTPSGVDTSHTADASAIAVGLRSVAQRVEEEGPGGGGGGGCFIVGLMCIDLTLTSGANSLRGGTEIPFDPSASLLNFSFYSSLNETLTDVRPLPPGFLEHPFIHGSIQLIVANGSANVALTLTGPFDNPRTFTANGTGSAVQSQTPCTAGTPFGNRSARTEVTLELPHLGRTTIVVVGRVLCSP